MRHPLLRNHPDAPRLAVQTFWMLVIATLVLLLGGWLVAGSRLVESPVILATTMVLAVLWTAHAVDVHSHSRQEHADPAFRRARERRGF